MRYINLHLLTYLLTYLHDESHSNSSSSHAQLELYRASGKLREKSSVLNTRLKAGRVVDEITSAGRAFQTRSAMTGKARSPTVDSHNIGAAKVSEDHDRNCCLDCTLRSFLSCLVERHTDRDGAYHSITAPACGHVYFVDVVS